MFSRRNLPSDWRSSLVVYPNHYADPIKAQTSPCSISGPDHSKMPWTSTLSGDLDSGKTSKAEFPCWRRAYSSWSNNATNSGTWFLTRTKSPKARNLPGCRISQASPQSFELLDWQKSKWHLPKRKAVGCKRLF